MSLACLLGAAACGAESLTDTERTQALRHLEARLDAVDIVIDPGVGECVASEFDRDTALSLGHEELTESEARSVAELIVDCDDTSQIGGLLLRPLAPTAATESLSCASSELGEDYVAELLLDVLMTSHEAQSIVDADVTIALALCLSPEELLDYAE